MIFWERQKSLTAFYEACTKPVRDTYDLTQMQFNILMFLHNNPQFDTAGDLVKTRHLTKSHVSTALKELEVNIYASRKAPKPSSRREKRRRRCSASSFLKTSRREKPSSTKCCLTKCVKTPQKA